MAWKNRKSLTVSLVVPSVVYLLVFFSGALRGFEYKLYDLNLRLRPTESIDQRIVIVGVTEQDLQKLGRATIDDLTLAKVIGKIKAQNPRVIGLDLHRNVKVGNSGSEELSELFRQTPNLIGIEKTTGGNPWSEAILPHPELAKAKRTGASELISDRDGVIRRAYLYVQKSAAETFPSFGLAVALKYLEQESIQPVGYKTWLKLKGAVFPEIGSTEISASEGESGLFSELNNKFKEFNKFYPSDEIDGYQILLNYRANRNLFERISIFELLEPDFFRINWQDKIVLIGRVDELSKDFYAVPHFHKSEVSQDWAFGVTIHAYLVSYLIDAALEGRTTFKFLPTLVGNSLILLLLLEPLWLIDWLDKKRQKAVNLLRGAGGQIVLILVSGQLCLHLVGYWLPVGILMVMTSVITATLGFLIYHHRHEQEKLNLSKIIEQKSQELKTAYQKIMAQEKIFTYQGLAQIISHEIKNKTNTINASAQSSYENLSLLKEIIAENYFIFEDFEEDEGFIDPRQLCRSGLEDTRSILQSVQKITWILQELNKDTGRESLEVSPVNLNESLKIIVAELIRIKPIKYLKIQANYDNSLPELVGLKQHIERALENLVANAFDALWLRSRESIDYLPVLKIVTINKSDLIEIKIRDNGKGIPLGSLKEIFKIHWTTKSEIGGQGLGLFFAQQFIHEHGGNINVETKLGKYTEFIIQLPKTKC